MFEVPDSDEAIFVQSFQFQKAALLWFSAR